MTTTAPALPRVAHEEFCPSMYADQTPRMEQYRAKGDDGTGRERVLVVTRCLDCGAARYTNP